jgi:homoserine dehydrogenase
MPRAADTTPAPFYLRMMLEDRPGALALIATALGDAGISIDRMRQYDHPGPVAPVLIVTHATARPALNRALAGMATTGVLAGTPVALRIEDV